MAPSTKHLLISAAVLVACSTQDAEPGAGPIDAAADVSATRAEAEASTSPNTPDGSGGSYPIDPDGPPPDCILPCVWEAMKRCPGPKPGQVCVIDTLTLQGPIQCCPMAPSPSREPVLCSDTSWFADTVNSAVYKDGEACWWRRGRAMEVDFRPPGQRPLDWTSTWYVRDDGTGAEVRIATLEHDRPDFQNALIGNGACYDGDDVVFTTRVDFSAEHCQKWYPECEVPGVCPVPPDLRDSKDAVGRDAAPEATPSPDPATSPDATVDGSMPADAPHGG